MSDLEGDSVRLRVEYSVNGVDWNRATLQASDSIDAKYNWWGTADRNEIISKIYDFFMMME